jgi:hypothetical protein
MFHLPSLMTPGLFAGSGSKARVARIDPLAQRANRSRDAAAAG